MDYAIALLAKRKEWWAILSPVLRFTNGTPWSHCAWLMDIDGDLWVYDSVPPRARKILYSEWSKSYEIVTEYHYQMTVKEHNAMIFALEIQVGKRYAWGQYIPLGLELIWKPLQRFFYGKSYDNDKTMFCTEFIMRPLKQVFGFIEKEDPDFCSLKDAGLLLDALYLERNAGAQRASKIIHREFGA